MDKKLTFTGGEPDINIDDLLRDPIANRAALFGLLVGMGGAENLKISGSAVTIDPLVDAIVTAGYVWLNGEILQVDAATVSETQGTDLWEFQKAVTYDAAGDKTFNDAIPRQTWQKNRAILVNVAAIAGMDAVNALSILTTVNIPIGDWDMSTLASVTIPHAIGAYKKIKKVSVVIISDDDAFGIVKGSYPINSYVSAATPTPGGSIGRITDTNITLVRTTGGVFDTADFNSTSFNRGFIVVDYTP